MKKAPQTCVSAIFGAVVQYPSGLSFHQMYQPPKTIYVLVHFVSFKVKVNFAALCFLTNKNCWWYKLCMVQCIIGSWLAGLSMASLEHLKPSGKLMSQQL